MTPEKEAFVSVDAHELNKRVRKDLNLLQNISLAFQPREFIVVVGTIGSGKSSLLAGLVGEMQQMKGDVILGGNVGFCPQVPWIQNATLRNNILFGNLVHRLCGNQIKKFSGGASIR